MFTKDVKYVEGKQNHMADFLSRKTSEALIGEAYKTEKNPEMENVTKEESKEYDKIKIAATNVVEKLKLDTISPKELESAQKSCADIVNIKKGNHPTSCTFEDVDIDGSSLYCETSGQVPRPVVPEGFRQQIMRAYHLDHPGESEAKRRTSSGYFWPNMGKQISKFVKECHPCQSTKPSKMKSNIGDFPVPQKRFSHIHVDVVGPLPASRGFRYLLSVICRSTRYFDAIPIQEASTKACADALLHSWIARHGLSSFCTSVL